LVYLNVILMPLYEVTNRFYWFIDMKRIYIACLFFLAFIVSSYANEGPEISEYKLDNGLKLIVIPDRRAPVVTHMVWYKAGSADDPIGKSGIAHFLEHLLFKKTKNYPQGEFSTAVSEIGGQENAFTSYDYTAYYQKVSPAALPEMMKYESDRMRNIVITDDVVIPERKVILEERAGRINNSPGAILSEFTQSSLFVHHPYGTPIIGWEHEISELTGQDALDFYEKWYQPWNAIVVVAGDVEPDDVFEMTKATYGKVEASQPEIIRKRVTEPQPVVAKTLQYKDGRVTNPSWQRSYLVPSYRLGQEREAEALDLLSAILGGSVTSRIHKELVLGKELATNAGAWYQGSSREMSTFGLYASPRGEAELDQLEQALLEVVDKLVEEGVTQEELDKARKTYLKSIIFSQDSQVSLARIFGSVLSVGGTVKDFTGWSDKLNAVTVEDINKVAKKYLLHDKSVTSKLLPKEEG